MMKTIGMLGGMSWESTTSYYQKINNGIKEALGGLNSARICLYSVNFDEIEKFQREGNWQATAELLSKAAKSVEAGGADFLIICTNTMHKVAGEIESAINIPILHIADATAEKLVENKVVRVGLLGTKFTMEQDFYKGRLEDKYGIQVLVPEQKKRNVIHDVIYNELCVGIIKEQSREYYIDVISCLYEQGAEAVILGCTEIALLVQQQHTHIPLYDTTEIHAEKAVKFAISKGS